MSPSSIAENTNTSAGPVEIGTLSAIDPDSGAFANHTFTLVAGAGDADNGRFTISGNKLQIKQNEVINFEAQASYAVRVNVSDGLNNLPQTLTVSVTDVNEAPGLPTLSPSSIAENTNTSSGPVEIGMLSAIDPDSGAFANHTFTLVAGAGDADNGRFMISGNKLQIKQNEVINFEARASYAVRVNVFDGANNVQQMLAVTVTDVNEAPTGISLSNSTIAENTDTSNPVLLGSLSVSDVDVGDTHTFSLVLGAGDTDNDNDKLQIDGNQLQVRVGTVVDHETDASYSVRIRVTDAGNNSFTKTFTIQVTNVNESPVGLTLSNDRINESVSTSGGPVTVGTLSATDETPATSLSYVLIAGSGDTDNGTFQIVGTALQIRQGTLLDHETQSSYSVRVQVDDGEFQLERAFTIAVTDQNETPTSLQLSPAIVDENLDTSVAQTVGSLSAMDDSPSSEHVFALVPGEGDADNGRFAVAGNTLRLQAGPALDFETRSQYFVRLQVTDGGGLSFSQAVVIQVRDVNESPISMSLGNSVVAENTDTAGGLLVGTLGVTDLDVGDRHTVSLAAGTGDADNSVFEVRNDSELYFRASTILNYEARSSYSLRLSAEDEGGLRYEQIFTIQISDVNEAPTNLRLSNNLIAENTETASVISVGTLAADDVDADDTQTFTLVAGPGDLDNRHFQITDNQLQFKAGTILDHELQANYAVRLRVADSAGLIAEQTLTIQVTDVNEAPGLPTLSPSSIAENTNTSAGPVEIGTLSATDPDSGEFANHTFTLVAGSGDGDNDRFSISGNKLQLKQNETVNFESQPSYAVRVSVFDGANTVEQILTVTATDVNEAPGLPSLSPSTIAENTNTSAGPVDIGTLSAIDPDGGTFANHTFTLVAGSGDADNDRFSISGNKLQLKQNEVVNFESQPSYAVRVSVFDGANTVEQTLTVTATDVNEAPGLPSLSPSSIAENANTSAGPVEIGTLSATDPDSGAFANHTFTLVAGSGDGDNDRFSISGSKLQLKQNETVNFESQSSYAVRVKVFDGANTVEQTLTVAVTDVNEAPGLPNLSPSSIAENANTSAGPVEIGTLSATDPDGGVFANHTFTLVAGSGDADNNRFSISGNKLQLKQNETVNFESQPSYAVRVSVFDGANTVEQTLTVTVTDVNEAPGLPSLSPSTIVENTNTSAGPVEIGTLLATDPDSGAFAHHMFTLVAGSGDADNGRFSISGNKLQLKQNETVNFETQPSYAVRVNVFDGANTVEQTLTVTVADVNETPGLPSVSPSSIVENTNTSAGPVDIGTLSAIDPDGGEFANHTFTLVAGSGDADNDRFSIGGNKLQLKRNETVNFESQPSYEVRVNVFDGANTVEHALTVTVTDVNEAPGLPGLSPSSLAENTNTSAGPVEVGTLSAIDPDGGVFANHSFTLVAESGDADNNRFSISGNKLRLKQNETVNFESQPSYTVRVNVFDGANTVEQTLTVTVTDVNEAPGLPGLSPSSIVENTNTSAGPVDIGTLSAIDPDGGAFANHSFTLVAGSGDADNDRFSIGGNKLQLKQNETVNFETQPSYTVRVSVFDGANTVEQTLTVTVTDVNEAPGLPGLSPSSIAENTNTSAGLVDIGTLSAIDPDGGAFANHTFTLVAGSGDVDNDRFSISGNKLQLKQNETVNFETQPSYTVRVSVFDGANTVEHTLTVAVTDVNEAPTLDDGSAETSEDDPVAFALSANDPDGDPLTFRVVAPQNIKGLVDISSDGKLTYDPSQVVEFQNLGLGQSSIESIVVEVADGRGETVTGTITITIHGNYDFYNRDQPLDVNRDGDVSPLDVLIVINYLNAGGSSLLPGVIGLPEFSLDTNNDGSVSPLDALIIINQLNSSQLSGEASPSRSENAITVLPATRFHEPEQTKVQRPASTNGLAISNTFVRPHLRGEVSLERRLRPDRSANHMRRGDSDLEDVLALLADDVAGARLAQHEPTLASHPLS